LFSGLQILAKLAHNFGFSSLSMVYTLSGIESDFMIMVVSLDVVAKGHFGRL